MSSFLLHSGCKYLFVIFSNDSQTAGVQIQFQFLRCDCIIEGEAFILACPSSRHITPTLKIDTNLYLLS